MTYRCSIATAIAPESQLSGWILLVDRVPTEPASGRVSVWRRLKRMGGDFMLFDIPALRPGGEEQIIATFRDLRNKDCAEIIEECETNFVKEIEFKRFRQRRGPPNSLRRRPELSAHGVPGHDARRARTALEISGSFEHATEAAPNPGAASVRGNVLVSPRRRPPGCEPWSGSGRTSGSCREPCRKRCRGVGP